MAVQLTKEFWLNIILFLITAIALGIAIWAFATPCKKSESFLVNDDDNICKKYLENYPIIKEGSGVKGSYYKSKLDLAQSIVKDITGSTVSESCKNDDLVCAIDLLNKYNIDCNMDTQPFCSVSQYLPNKCVFRPFLKKK